MVVVGGSAAFILLILKYIDKNGNSDSSSISGSLMFHCNIRVSGVHVSNSPLMVSELVAPKTDSSLIFGNDLYLCVYLCTSKYCIL